jgi:nicotinamidase/pyrazinamidase
MGNIIKKNNILLTILLTFSSTLVAIISDLNDNKIGAIVVDVQGCFTQAKNGSLAVPNSDDAYIKKVNSVTQFLYDNGVSIYATQDWHPKNHMSFYTNHAGKKASDVIPLSPEKGLKKNNQVLWPPHCEQNSGSAEILVKNSLFEYVQKKGTNPNYDSYSGFEDDNGQSTGLEARLKKDGIKRLIIYGIATDYCVKETALDAKKAGFDVVFVKELSRGVAEDSIKAAIEQMKSAGIKVVNQIIAPRKPEELFNRVT